MNGEDYAPEIQDPGDGDMFGAFEQAVNEAVAEQRDCRLVPPARERCSSCGHFLPKNSTYVNRCADCWTPEDDFL